MQLLITLFSFKTHPLAIVVCPFITLLAYILTLGAMSTVLSIYTDEILNILDKYNVKATFFVVCSENLEEYAKKYIEKGHTIGLHSCTHKYSSIYSSEDDYFNDLQAIGNKVKNLTGNDSKIIRFPGGGSNTISRKYSKGIMSVLTNEVQARG